MRELPGLLQVRESNKAGFDVCRETILRANQLFENVFDEIARSVSQYSGVLIPLCPDLLAALAEPNGVRRESMPFNRHCKFPQYAS